MTPLMDRTFCPTSFETVAWPERKAVHLEMSSEPCSIESIISQISEMKGPIEVYTWYEGPQYLPKSGALFMKEKFFAPLYQLKKDAKLYLYSLRGWNFTAHAADIPSSTSLGQAINRINLEAIECIFSASFFRYCSQISSDRGIYPFLTRELPQKKWLLELSHDYKKVGTTVEDFFNQTSSLFDCIKDLDVSSSYSAMQYVEGYYLIQESVRKALEERKKDVQIVFVLPNDEGKYYQDLPSDIEKMLVLDFGDRISTIGIFISFYFFRYGDSLEARPYLDPQKRSEKIKPEQIASYFDYLSRNQPPKNPILMPFLRDVIHNFT